MCVCDSPPFLFLRTVFYVQAQLWIQSQLSCCLLQRQRSFFAHTDTQFPTAAQCNSQLKSKGLKEPYNSRQNERIELKESTKEKGEKEKEKKEKTKLTANSSGWPPLIRLYCTLHPHHLHHLQLLSASLNFHSSCIVLRSISHI